MYRDLREEGNSKEKSARISNAAAARGGSSVGRKGGEAGSYDDWTVSELKERAKELGLSGYSSRQCRRGRHALQLSPLFHCRHQRRCHHVVILQITRLFRSQTTLHPSVHGFLSALLRQVLSPHPE
jgi:hypothetical protein